MIKNTKQLNKRQKELTARFRMAYERLSFTQRQVAKQMFCAAHRITDGTFRNKTSGVNNVAEIEVEWMERVASDPYTELRQPQTI